MLRKFLELIFIFCVMAGRYHSKAAGAASSEEEEEEGRADPFAAPLSEDQQERARRYLRPGAVADLEKLTEVSEGPPAAAPVVDRPHERKRRKKKTISVVSVPRPL